MQRYPHLKNVRIAAPCNASWSSMAGDDRKRFCGDCQLNVYSLSDMSAPEAEEFLRRSEGRVCIRYYQRPDGTILTRNCPTGLMLMRQRLARAITFCTAIMLSGFAVAMSPFVKGVITNREFEEYKNSVRKKPGVGPVVNFLDPPPPECETPVLGSPVFMGRADPFAGLSAGPTPRSAPKSCPKP